VRVPSTSQPDIAQGQFVLARALTGARKDPKRARGLAEKAEATLAKEHVTPLDDRNLARVRAWLEAHPE
jgi:hypothetical protein